MRGVRKCLHPLSDAHFGDHVYGEYVGTASELWVWGLPVNDTKPSLTPTPKTFLLCKAIHVPACRHVDIVSIYSWLSVSHWLNWLVVPLVLCLHSNGSMSRAGNPYSNSFRLWLPPVISGQVQSLASILPSKRTSGVQLYGCMACFMEALVNLKGSNDA